MNRKLLSIIDNITQYTFIRNKCLLVVEDKFNELGGSAFSLPVKDAPPVMLCPGRVLLNWILFDEIPRWYCWLRFILPAE